MKSTSQSRRHVVHRHRYSSNVAPESGGRHRHRPQQALTVPAGSHLPPPQKASDSALCWSARSPGTPVHPPWRCHSPSGHTAQDQSFAEVPTLPSGSSDEACRHIAVADLCAFPTSVRSSRSMSRVLRCRLAISCCKYDEVNVRLARCSMTGLCAVGTNASAVKQCLHLPRQCGISARRQPRNASESRLPSLQTRDIHTGLAAHVNANNVKSAHNIDHGEHSCRYECAPRTTAYGRAALRALGRHPISNHVVKRPYLSLSHSPAC